MKLSLGDMNEEEAKAISFERKLYRALKLLATVAIIAAPIDAYVKLAVAHTENEFIEVISDKKIDIPIRFEFVKTAKRKPDPACKT